MSIQHTSDESCITKPQPIADNWKLLAISHYFIHELNEPQAIALYDALEYADTTDAARAAWQNSSPTTLPKPEFEFLPDIELSILVIRFTRSAQRLANQ